MDNWGKYLRAKEPGVREKAYVWKTAIGLQKVDEVGSVENCRGPGFPACRVWAFAIQGLVVFDVSSFHQREDRISSGVKDSSPGKVHPHYNLPRERLALLERFLQKRVSDILQYGLDADDYLDVREGAVGVKNKIKRPDVGVKCDDLDACALQMLWNMKANPNITARELADVLGLEQRTIERRIRVLREKGIVRRVGVDKTGHWEVLLEV